MRTLFFARHGESEANITHVFANRGDGPDLTPLGRSQSEALARRLESFGITEIHSSPLARARQTAEPIATLLGLPVIVDEALREYDVGELEGQANPDAWRRYAELERRWLIDREWHARHSGGESYHELSLRFGSYLDRVRGKAAGPLLIVAHGGIFRMMLPRFLTGVGFEQSFAARIPNCGVIEAGADGRLRWDLSAQAAAGN